MKKQQINYNVGVKSAVVRKAIVAVIFFAVLANVINLGSFYRGNAVEVSAGLMQVEIGLSKIFNKIYVPINKIADLFNESKKVSKSSNSEKFTDSNKFAVIVKPINRVSNAELSKKDLFFPSDTKLILSSIQVDIGALISQKSQFYNNNFIMILMMLLLLWSVLPRGVPSRKQKNINNIITRPVLN